MQNIDHTNYEQQTHNFKVRTPAALFSQTAIRSPVQQSHSHSRNISQSQLQHPCQNHPHKEGTFFCSSNQDTFHFCEKCAITLASQGHSISKIGQGQMQGVQVQDYSMQDDFGQGQEAYDGYNQGQVSYNQGQDVYGLPQEHMHRSPSPSSMVSNSRVTRSTRSTRSTHSVRQTANPRSAQMQDFLQSIRQIRSTIQSSKTTIKDKLIESQQFYGAQLEQINDYFDLVIKSLQLQKHKCYNHILKERQQAELNIRGLNHQLQQIDEEATKILLDVEDNFETVYSIEEEMYRLVLGQYRKQHEQFQGQLGDLLMMPIQMRKIEFEGVPESIYNLSDFVIQNSASNQSSQQYRLVDSLSAEDFNNIRAVSPRETDVRRDTTPYRQISEAESLKFSFEGQRLRAEGHEGYDGHEEDHGLSDSSKEYLCDE